MHGKESDKRERGGCGGRGLRLYDPHVLLLRSSRAVRRPPLAPSVVFPDASPGWEGLEGGRGDGGSEVRF